MISIIVVSHDAAHHLERCLHEIETELRHGLESGEIEVIVVDNASSDGSPRLVRERHPRCRLLELPRNVGFGGANNRGAELARGEFLLLLNSDAWLGAASLEQLKTAMVEDRRLALVAPQLRYPDARLQFVWAPTTGVVGEAVQKLRNRFEGAEWNHRLLPRLWRALGGSGWYSAACVLLRRDAFEQIGGFDEDIFLYFEDVDLCRRLQLAGWKTAQVETATAFHVKGGSQRADRAEIEYRRGQLYYYRKHRPSWENRVLRRRLRHKFNRIHRLELRRSLLGLLDTVPDDTLPRDPSRDPHSS